MAKNDNNAWIDALAVLSSGAVELHGLNVAAREAALERAWKSEEKEEERTYAFELAEMNKKWELEYNNLQQAQRRQELVTNEYQTVYNNMMQTYGAVPGGSQPVNKIISNAYTPTVTNLNAVVNQTVAGTAAIQQNLNNLTTQGQQAIAEARVVYNQLF